MEQEYDDSDNKCASKAKVIVKAKDESPNIVWIQAVDKGNLSFFGFENLCDLELK